MSTHRLVTWITFLAVFAMAARVSLDSDTWWHLRAGGWMIEHGSLLQADIFSYTRLGAEWKYPGWLAEIPMALIYRFLGAGGLNLWTAAMVTLTFVFIWHALSGGVFLRAFIVVLAAAASGLYWAARPYLVTFLFTAVFLWILDRALAGKEADPRAERRLWWLPVLMALWANSHGGFIAGFLILGAYGAGELAGWITHRPARAFRATPLPRLLAVGLLMAGGVCLNPAGPEMLLYPFKTLSIGALGEYIQEWQPPDFHAAQTQPFIWLLLLTFGAVGASRRRLKLSDFLLVAGFAYLSFMAARNVALFALAAPLALSRHAAPLADALARQVGFRADPGAASPGMRRLNGVLFGLLVLAVGIKAAAALPPDANLAEIRKTTPVEAVNAIRSAAPPGRLFNSYNWGGYLLWALPEYPVFIDGRTDLYDDELVGEWLRVVRVEAGWQETLARWEVRLVLIEPGLPLAEALRDEGWTVMYQDPLAVVLMK